MRPRQRKLLKILAALALLYLLLAGAVLAAMFQPPDRFGQIMAKVPRPLYVVFLVIPFEPLWNIARAGHLQVGDQAPDFHLEVSEKKPAATRAQSEPRPRLRLSSFRGHKPVVLVFGSYT